MIVPYPPPGFKRIKQSPSSHLISIVIGLWIPNDEFSSDPSKFLNNKLLNLGHYPHFLWLYKEYLPQFQQMFVFHDHLLQHVRQWKAALKLQEYTSQVKVGNRI